VGAEPGLILVLYQDGSYQAYRDSWSKGDPETDPAISPPAGMVRPVRGFGKVWREEPGVGDGLGWATASEQGFDSMWQRPIAESLSDSAELVHRIDGKVILLRRWVITTTGSLEVVSP